MDFQLSTDAVLLGNVSGENLQAGDIGTVVERHDVAGLETGYSVEFFDMLGNTVAVVTSYQPITCSECLAGLELALLKRCINLPNHIQALDGIQTSNPGLGLPATLSITVLSKTSSVQQFENPTYTYVNFRTN